MSLRNSIRCCVLSSLLFVFPYAALNAATIYVADLSGAAESPTNGSLGFGTVTVKYDAVAHTLKVDASFADLIGLVTAAHIHCCTAAAGAGAVAPATPTPSFPSFPSGVTVGVYSFMFDLTNLTSFNAAFVTANGGSAASAELALASGLAAGKAYFNIHTSAYTGGEIRGFLAPVPVPAAVWLFVSGLLGLIAVARGRAMLVYN